MNDEIPYNPPGMDEYRREGARKNRGFMNIYELNKYFPADEKD